jgi:hypothetical protein
VAEADRKITDFKNGSVSHARRRSVRGSRRDPEKSVS